MYSVYRALAHCIDLEYTYRTQFVRKRRVLTSEVERRRITGPLAEEGQ